VKRVGLIIALFLSFIGVARSQYRPIPNGTSRPICQAHPTPAQSVRYETLADANYKSNRSDGVTRNLGDLSRSSGPIASTMPTRTAGGTGETNVVKNAADPTHTFIPHRPSRRV